MSNLKSKQQVLEDLQWIRENYMTEPSKCLEMLSNIESDDPYIIANKWNVEGIIAFWKNELLFAYQNFQKVLSSSREHNFIELEAKGLINQSVVNIHFKRYHLALEDVYKSLKLNFEHLKGIAYNNLSLIYKDLGNHEKHLEYLIKSKSYNERAGDKRALAANLGQIGRYYLRIGNHQEAITTYEECLDLVKENKFNTLMGPMYRNIAEVYLKLDDYQKALEYSKEAIRYGTMYDRQDTIVNANLLKASALFYLDEYVLAGETLQPLFEEKIFGQDSAYHKLFELNLKVVSKTNPDKVVDCYKDYINFLKKDIEKLEDRNSLEEILKLHEQEIEFVQKRNEMIERQNKELKVVSKLLAHDLKTPVRTIGSFVGLLEKKLESNNDPAIKEYIDFISSGAHEMNETLDITKHYLNFNLSENWSTFDLNKVIEFLGKTIKKNLLEIEVDKKLPMLYGDNSAVRLMFTHLVQFIILHNEGRTKLSITHKEEANDELIILSDHGNSFKYVQYWFKEVLLSDMIQSGKVDLRFAFVRKIVNLHGGSLLIEEDKNHHFVLKIWIPKKVKSNKEHFKRK